MYLTQPCPTLLGVNARLECSQNLCRKYVQPVDGRIEKDKSHVSMTVQAANVSFATNVILNTSISLYGGTFPQVSSGRRSLSFASNLILFSPHFPVLSPFCMHHRPSGLSALLSPICPAHTIAILLFRLS